MVYRIRYSADELIGCCRLWHPGRYEDVLHTVHFLHAQFPCASIRLCGYSAGSNLCLQTLFHLYSHHQLHLVQSCCVVCICYDYFQARHRLENSSIGLVYSVLMCLLLKDIIRKNMHMFHHREEYIESCLSRCLLLSHYDRIVGKELHGYREMDELQRRTNLSLLRKVSSAPPLVGAAAKWGWCVAADPHSCHSTRGRPAAYGEPIPSLPPCSMLTRASHILIYSFTLRTWNRAVHERMSVWMNWCR